MSDRPNLVCGVDPGAEHTAYVVWNREHGCIEAAATIAPELFLLSGHPFDASQHENGRMELAIEIIVGYGMGVGAPVFRTAEWIGRYTERFLYSWGGVVRRLSHKDVKQHLCGTSSARNSEVRDALLERFGPGREKAVGTKKNKGPLWGIKGHEWDALAVAITAAETSTPAATTERA